MNIDEMRIILDVVDALEEGAEVNLMIDDSRDGNTSLSDARLIPRRLADDRVVLLVRYE